MQQRRRIGIGIACVFSIIAFLFTLYNAFFSANPTTGLAMWLMGLLILLSIICSFAMLRSKSTTPGVINILSLITAGIFTVFFGLYWILIMLIVALIGCIMHKASMAH